MPRDSGEWNRAQKVKGRGPFTPTEALFTAFFSGITKTHQTTSGVDYLAFRGSLCVLELSMTPYNHVGMRSLSRSDHTGRQWQLPELSALSENKLRLKKLLLIVPATFRGPLAAP